MRWALGARNRNPNDSLGPALSADRSRRAAYSQEAANRAPSGAPPPLSAIAHDFTTWLNHVAGNGAKNHRAGRPSSLPQTRPASEPASARVASNKQWSEFVPSPGASKKKTATLVQIRD
jgi:hypothetical protein